MIKVQGFTEIPNDYDYMGMFALKDLIGKDFSDGEKDIFILLTAQIFIFMPKHLKNRKRTMPKKKSEGLKSRDGTSLLNRQKK